MKTTAVRLIDLLWPTRPATPREGAARALPVLTNITRLTLASVLAYAITRWLVHGPMDLTSALTALLVMQASATSSFKQGALKVVGVASGIGLALGMTSLVGMSWWSLGLLIFTALLAARMLRLGDASLEMPISAMLILGSVGRNDVAAETRMVGTLIGTLVGIILPLLLPPALPYRSAAASVRRVAASERDVLLLAADELAAGSLTRPAISVWLEKARQITGQIGRAHEAVQRLTEVRKFNSRAVGTADASPVLTSGLYTLETCLLSLRAIFQMMERRAPVADHPSLGGRAGTEAVFGEQVEASVAQVLRELAACLDSFGAMVEAEANGNEQKAHDEFVTNYRRLRTARAELKEVMAVQEEFSDRWLFGGTLLAALDEVLRQLDVDARVRMRERWKASQLGRRLPESTIGPRSSTLDRFRFERMRARRLRRPEPKGTAVDFTGDDETTTTIPRIDHTTPDPREPDSRGLKSRGLDSRRPGLRLPEARRRGRHRH